MFGYRRVQGYLISHKPHSLVLSKILAVSMNDGTFTKHEYKKMRRLVLALDGSKHFDVELTGQPKSRAFWIHYNFACNGDEMTIDLENQMEFLEKVIEAK